MDHATAWRKEHGGEKNGEATIEGHKEEDSGEKTQRMVIAQRNAKEQRKERTCKRQAAIKG